MALGKVGWNRSYVVTIPPSEWPSSVEILKYACTKSCCSGRVETSLTFSKGWGNLFGLTTNPRVDSNRSFCYFLGYKLWRRRPEVLRRIMLLRSHPHLTSCMELSCLHELEPSARISSTKRLFQMWVSYICAAVDWDICGGGLLSCSGWRGTQRRTVVGEAFCSWWPVHSSSGTVRGI